MYEIDIKRPDTSSEGLGRLRSRDLLNGGIVDCPNPSQNYLLLLLLYGTFLPHTRHFSIQNTFLGFFPGPI